MSAPAILVFDSGLGGLTVFREVVQLRPDARYVYAADDAFFPYGAHSAGVLRPRVLDVMTRLIDQFAPNLVIVACNTASTLVLPDLRARFDLPFVGTVPPIKPACAASRSRLVSVLGTRATVDREYTQALVRDFGRGCEVTLVGSERLAAIAEAALRDEPVDDAEVAREIAPCFVETGAGAGVRRTDVVALGCTHFPLLLERLQRLAPWPVDWFDPAEAIARRVLELLGPAPAGASPSDARVVFTSERAPSDALAASLRRFGLKTV